MKKRLLFTLPSIILFIASCTSTSQAIPYQMQGEIDVAKLEWYSKEGYSTIYGNSFIRDSMAIQRGPHTCAGFDVTLIAVDKYFEEYLLLFFDNLDNSFWQRSSPRYDVEFDSTATSFGQETTCDSQGNFEFSNLAEGSYWIITAVSYEGGPFRTLPPTYKGGWLLKRVYVDGKNDKKVVISK